jgi:hypothetical protein
MIAWRGEPRILNESTILEIFASNDDPQNISFANVKKYVLDPYVGDKFNSRVEIRADFEEWRNYAVQRVEESIPPLISYASPAGSHIGAVVETDATSFKVHEPEAGDYVHMTLSDLSRLRRRDILIIEPRGHGSLEEGC